MNSALDPLTWDTRCSLRRKGKRAGWVWAWTRTTVSGRASSPWTSGAWTWAEVQWAWTPSTARTVKTKPQQLPGRLSDWPARTSKCMCSLWTTCCSDAIASLPWCSRFPLERGHSSLQLNETRAESTKFTLSTRCTSRSRTETKWRCYTRRSGLSTRQRTSWSLWARPMGRGTRTLRLASCEPWTPTRSSVSTTMARTTLSFQLSKCLKSGRNTGTSCIGMNPATSETSGKWLSWCQESSLTWALKTRNGTTQSETSQRPSTSLPPNTQRCALTPRCGDLSKTQIKSNKYSCARATKMKT